MTTAVPQISLGPNGFIAPAATDVLAGVIVDINNAFGNTLNFPPVGSIPVAGTVAPPQMQLATSESTIINDENDQLLALFNGVDPAFASGRMQDAIGRIYYIIRIAAAPTVVTANCVGLAGTVIPVGATAQDQAGNLYISTESGTIPVGGTIALTFACSITGPIACPGAVAPNGYLNTVYQAISGWDSINNTTDGVLGNTVETRADFEFRRSASVAHNAQGSVPSVLGAVLQVPGVLDAYALDNPLPVASGAVFTGSISTTTLTVVSIASGRVNVGDTVLGAAQGTVITSMIGGSGGTGTYGVSINQTASTCTGSAVGGFSLGPNSLYVAAYGGVAQDIGQAIWTKKSPGCNYNGNTTVTVVDSASNYNPPYPSYRVTFEIPTPTPIKFAVVIQNNPLVPSNAVTLIQNAIIQSFTGADGGQRARIGSAIFASRFYGNISALGSWAMIYSILLGVGSANQTSVLININQIPTIVSTDIAVTVV